MDSKWLQFLAAARDDPGDFFDRVANRYLGATVWYVPFNRGEEAQRPWLLWLRRFAHPLPLLAILLLVLSTASGRASLTLPQSTAIGVYWLYLLPYVATSYYERYAVPLLGVKSMLIVWAAAKANPSLLQRIRR
jgi:hypothetical protein